jgi:hypothetical protein
MEDVQNIPMPAPPKLAEWLLEKCSAKENATIILGDFAEQFLDVAQEKGVAAAQSWYWSEFFKSLPSLLQQHKLENVMTNSLIISASATFGIILYVFVFAAAPEWSLFRLLWESGPVMSILIGLLFASIGVIIKGFLIKPTDVIELEQILNTLNGIFSVSILFAILGFSLGLTLAFNAIMKAGGVIELPKFGGALSEIIFNIDVGLINAVISKTAYHFCKGRIIREKA